LKEIFQGREVAEEEEACGIEALRRFSKGIEGP